MVIRNGFYNFNYIVEDSYLDACGEFETVSPRIKKMGPIQLSLANTGSTKIVMVNGSLY